jgi:exodeoxyribonuclease-3
VYVPNGQSADSDKFQYKLRFLARLHAHMETLLGYGEMLAVGGDYNIAPEDRDVHNPQAWAGSVLTHDDLRAWFRRILGLGMYDAYRSKNEANDYSWWDYRTGAFERDDGLRIDHILLSPQACDRLESCHVKKELRALEKASDHAPVVVNIGMRHEA